MGMILVCSDEIKEQDRLIRDLRKVVVKQEEMIEKLNQQAKTGANNENKEPALGEPVSIDRIVRDLK